MKKSLFTLLFVSIVAISFAQSSNKTTNTETSDMPKMATSQSTSVSRGASNVVSTMATFHHKAIQKLYTVVAVLEEDEDTDIFASESAEDTEF